MSATSSVLHIPTKPTIALLLGDKVIPLIILIVLVPASVLGAFIGYIFGMFGIRRIIPFHNPERERRVKHWFEKHGGALLLISPWIPFAGDIVPIVAGVESFKLSTFLVIMFVGKAIKGTAIVLFLSFFVQLLNFYI